MHSSHSTVSLVQKAMTSLAFLGIASVFLLCLTIPLMNMMNMMNMESGSPCGMEHATALCPMTLAEHLGFWQKIAVPTPSNLSFLALLTSLVALTFSLKVARIQVLAHRLRFLRYKADILSPVVDYLKQQLSQGTLHSKIY